MPPYQSTPEETRSKLGRVGMEVAGDFVDNECLTRFTDEAIDWMGAVTTKGKEGTGAASPFFLYLPLTSPHYPVCPKREFWGQGDCGAYGEFVVETDHHIGRILDFLDEADLAENTLVIFTSDNGPEMSWRPRLKQFGHDSRGGLRGGKRDIYEGGHRVPFLMRWPKGIKEPGRVNSDLLGQVDLAATLAEIVGYTLPDTAGEDSVSFSSVLTDPGERQVRAPLMNHGVSGRFSITDGSFKLIFSHGDQGLELYDLSQDLQETQNLAAQEAKRVETLKEQAASIVANGRSTPGTKQPNDTGYWKDLTWMSPTSLDD